MKKKDLDEDDFSRGVFCPRETKVWVNYELPNRVKTSKNFNFVLAYGDEISLDVKFPEEIIKELRKQVCDEIREFIAKDLCGCSIEEWTHKIGWNEDLIKVFNKLDQIEKKGEEQ